MNEEKQTFDLTDDHVKILNQHAMNLRAFHAAIGSQLCEIMKNVQSAVQIEENITQIQEDIAKELGVPRANRLNWDLNQKKVEIH